MSDTEQMIRIMRHAAGLLATQARKLAEENRFQYPNAIAAMSYGRATLEMVAASVAPEGSERIGQIIGRLNEYNAWADKSTEIGMSDGELGAIGRFLRWVASDSGDVE